MWPKSYKDYPKDQDLIKYQVEPQKGITGCEMHEFNGWGLSYHRHKKKKPGFLRNLFGKFSRLFNKN